MRIIARLDIKNEHVIKGIHLEGLRKVGNPNQLASQYYDHGIDEIVFMDAVASLYDRNNLFDIIKEACTNVFVPIAIGGGIRSLDDVSKALESGADKVVINTAAIHDIAIIEKVANKFGSQSLVASIEAKKMEKGWNAFYNNGREPTNKEVTKWAQRLMNAGCGEILITSIDQEGTRKGFDIELIERVNAAVDCPIIVSGGYGVTSHLHEMLSRVKPSAIAFASALHYNKSTVSDIREVIEGK